MILPGKVSILNIKEKWQGWIIISIGIFMSTLDGSILNIANPTIAHELNVSIDQIQWVVTAYMLIITSSLLFFGKLGDKIGSQKVFTYGFLVFSLGSFFCSMSHTLAFLIFARVFQGLGASMLMATGMGITSNIFPPDERGKALGLSGTVVGIGNMTGPSLGGILVVNFTWPVIFLVNVPIGLIGFYMAKKHLPPQALNTSSNGYDIPGIILFAIGAAILLLSLNSRQGLNFALLSGALILLLAFYLWEKRTEQPILDFDLFKIKSFVFGNLMGLSAYSAQMSVLFLIPFYLQNLLSISPAYAGLLMTITPVTMAITAPIAGNLSDKLGSRNLLISSFALMTFSFLLFSKLGTELNLLLLCTGLILLGTGMGMFGSPNNSSIFSSIPKNKAGYGGGFISTIRNLSFALGIALSTSILTYLINIAPKDTAYSLTYVNSSSIVYKIAALITVAGLLLAVFTTSKKKNTSLPSS